MAAFTTPGALLTLLAIAALGPLPAARGAARLTPMGALTAARPDTTDTGAAGLSAAAAAATAAPLRHLLDVAAFSLQSTYTSINPQYPLFPDVVDADTLRWHYDDIDANGAAGLLAGSLWFMHRMTGSDLWRSHALTASAALRDAVHRSDMGQAVGTLAYPALRYAYEAEDDGHEKDLFLAAALRAATSLSTMFAKIPGVLKIRPTSDIASNVRNAGIAEVSQLAVFSSVEGAAAAVGLLAWASTLPGGRPVWRDMALRTAHSIAEHHLGSDGLIRPTLVFHASDAHAPPQTLESLLSSDPSSASASHAPSSSLLALFEDLFLVNGDGDESDPHGGAAAVMEAWLSAVAGQESSPELRQAMGTMVFVQAARASVTSADRDYFSTVAVVSSEALRVLALDPLSMDTAGAAATAAALAELSMLSTLAETERADYAAAARHVVVTLAQHSLARPVASPQHESLQHAAVQQQQQQQEQQQQQQESLASQAGRWLRSVLPHSGGDNSVESVGKKHRAGRLLRSLAHEAQQQQQGEAVERSALLTALLASGGSDPEPLGSEEAAADGLLLPAVASAAVLTTADGRGGSMLGDHLLLRALVALSSPAPARR